MSDAELHPALARARYRTKPAGDRFVGLWLDVLVTVRNGRSPRATIARFYADADVRNAIGTVGQDLVDAQLRDAARLYAETCLTDPAFSSGLFGLQRLKPDEVRAKLTKEIGTATTVLAGLDGPAPILARLLDEGYREALGLE